MGKHMVLSWSSRLNLLAVPLPGGAYAGGFVPPAASGAGGAAKVVRGTGWHDMLNAAEAAMVGALGRCVNRMDSAGSVSDESWEFRRLYRSTSVLGGTGRQSNTGLCWFSQALEIVPSFEAGACYALNAEAGEWQRVPAAKRSTLRDIPPIGAVVRSATSRSGVDLSGGACGDPFRPVVPGHRVASRPTRFNKLKPGERIVGFRDFVWQLATVVERAPVKGEKSKTIIYDSGAKVVISDKDLVYRLRKGKLGVPEPRRADKSDNAEPPTIDGYQVWHVGFGRRLFPTRELARKHNRGLSVAHGITTIKLPVGMAPKATKKGRFLPESKAAKKEFANDYVSTT